MAKQTTTQTQTDATTHNTIEEIEIKKRVREMKYSKRLGNAYDIKCSFENISGLAMFTETEKNMCYLVIFSLLFFVILSIKNAYLNM